MKARGLAPLVLACGVLTGSATAGQCAGYDELNAGFIAYVRGDIDNAIAHFGNALAQGGLTADQQYIAHYDRASLEFAQNRFEAAMDDINPCIGQREGDDDALLLRARLYVQARKTDLALQDMTAAVAADPGDVFAYGFRAQMYRLLDDPQKQMADLQAMKLLQPGNKSLDVSIGIAEFQLGRFADASASLEPALAGKPGYSWLFLSLSNLKQGKPLAPESTNLFDGQWPQAIVNFYRGTHSEQSASAAAMQGTDAAKKGQLCEFNFYVGEWHLLHRDASGGKSLLQAAVQNCPTDFIEYFAARTELKNVP